MNIKKRAISEDQKLEKRNNILKTALELFKNSSFDEINMEEIAKKTGVAKGTVFLYFKTKEELFLSLANDEIGKLFIDLNNSLIELNKKECSINDLLSIIKNSTANKPFLIRLTAILNIILEKNIDYKTASNFKITLHNNIVKTGTLLEQYFPFFKPGYGSKLIMWIYILIIGVQQASDPSPVSQKVINEAGLNLFNINFNEQFIDMIDIIIKGMEYKSREEEIF
jgi:AcrR family transcriptional regulator